MAKTWSPLAIDELIGKICKDRIEDKQLSDCPLTFEEVRDLKKSFSFTLLNMLHKRIDYPTKEPNEKANKENQSEKEAT